MTNFEVCTTIPLNNNQITIRMSEQLDEADEAKQQELRILLDKTTSFLQSGAQVEMRPDEQAKQRQQGHHLFFPFQDLSEVEPITNKQIALLKKFLEMFSIPETQFCEIYALSNLAEMAKDDAWWIIRRFDAI